MNTKLWFLLLIFILFDVRVFSQSNTEVSSRERTFSLFHEASYISFLGGVGNMEKLMFEANIIPYYQLSLSSNDRWGIELSPQVILRMYNLDSYPVRTPSFMPRATAFYHVQQSRNKPVDWFAYFSWCHHSNGQENSFYMTDSVSINTQSGNFATNSVEMGAFASKPEKRNPYAVSYTKIAIIYHYKQIKELHNHYGVLRFRLDMQTSVNLTKTLRFLKVTKKELPPRSSFVCFSTKFEWIAGKMGEAKPFDLNRLIASWTMSYKPSFFKDITLFSQVYYGQDYYNIYFNRQLMLLRFGIMAKPGLIN